MPSKLLAPVVGLLIVAILLGGAATGQAATPEADSATAGHALFVQTFAAGRWEPGAEAGTATLTLEQPAGQIVYFSDRPGRNAGVVSLEQFLTVLEDAAADPLNAALIIEGADPDQDQAVVVELLIGSAGEAGAVTYEVRVLADPSDLGFDVTSLAEPMTAATEALDFGTSHLFVDGGCTPIDPRC